jgi:hypothetical protein
VGGAISTSYFGTDLSYVINDLWTSVTGLASNPVSASVTDLGTASELDVGGEIFRITQSLVVCAGVISAPAIGNLVTLNGNERMIAGFSLSTDGISYTIELAEITT